MKEKSRSTYCGREFGHPYAVRMFGLAVVLFSIAGGDGILTPTAQAANNPFNTPRQNDLVGPIDAAANPLEFAIGVAIENLCPQLVLKDRTNAPLGVLERDLKDRCGDVLNEAGGTSDLSDELRQLTGDEVASMRSGAIELGAAQLARIGARLGTLRTAARDAPVFAMSGPTALRPDAPLAMQYQSGGAAGDGFGRWGVFVNGTVSTGDKDQTRREAGFDFDSYTLTGGVDYRVTDYAFAGVALGVSKSEADINSNSTNSLGGEVDTDGFTITAYGTIYREDGIYVEGSVGYGENDHETERNISYTASGTTVRQTAIGDTDGDQFFAHLAVGKDIPRNGWTIGVAGRLDYLDGEVDGFRERMSRPGAAGGGMALEIGDQDLESLTSTVGLQVAKAISTAQGVVQPFGRAEWIHQFEDESENVRARFVFDPFSENFVQGAQPGSPAAGSPTTFVIRSDDPDENYFRVGGGVSVQFAGGKAGFLALDTILGLDDVSNYILTLGFRWELGQGAP